MTNSANLVLKYLKQQQDMGVSEIIMERSNSAKTPITEEKAKLLKGLLEKTKNCANCHLSETRTNYVFGSGNPEANLMFIGEAPGRDEDLQGLPFVGAAGQLLTKMIEAMGLKRKDVFIGNMLKCRPPDNRDPQPKEILSCRPILDRQLEIIDPEYICALGRIAGQALLNTNSPLGKLRGQFHDYNGRKLMVTYHPSALLRNAHWKRPAWEDLQMLMREMSGR